MTRTLLHFLFAISPSIGSAIYFANPASPTMQCKGIFWSGNYSFRVGYLSDCLYRQRCRAELASDDEESCLAYTRLSTEAAVVTGNLWNCFDLVGILGNARLQIDHEIKAKNQFAWGIGGKWTLFDDHCLSMALDFKYFSSNQSPSFFLESESAYNIRSQFRMETMDMQAGLGLAYRVDMLSPYIYVTYIRSEIDSHPHTVILRMPQVNGMGQSFSPDIVNELKWGLAVGATVLSSYAGSLTVESRFFNQNAITITGEIRF